MAVLSLGLGSFQAGGSITIVGNALQLVNDSVAPGNNMFYGTNSTGTKTWYLSSSISVLAYGAIGNGTADESTAIQAAITAGGTGGITRIPYGASGLYIINATLTLPSNHTLIIDRGVTLRAKAALGAPVLTNADLVGGNTSIRIYGGTFDGNRSNQSVSSPVVKLANTTYSLLADCTITGGLENDSEFSGCLLLHDCSRIELRGVEVRTNTGNGLLSLGGSHLQIQGGNYSSNSVSGIDITTTPHSLVGGATAESNSATGISASSQYTTITGSVARANGDNGINIGHDSVPYSGSHSVVASNISTANGARGIYVQGDNTIGVQLIGNSAYGNTVNNYGYAAIGNLLWAVGFGQASGSNASGPALVFNAPTGTVSEFLDYKLAGVSKFYVEYTGSMYSAAHITAGGNLVLGGVTGNSTITGGAGEMTITSGTGNSRELVLRTTDVAGVARTAIRITDAQLVGVYGALDVTGVSIFGDTISLLKAGDAIFALKGGTAGINAAAIKYGTIATADIWQVGRGVTDGSNTFQWYSYIDTPGVRGSLDPTTGNFIIAGSATTGNPIGVTAKAWKLGDLKTGGTSSLVTDKYVEIDIDGTLVKLAVVTNS